ncbi:SRPBCC family protein [Actinospica durhamensis]|uniref:SRPBCC family protein n=1 Tax=Actinospica durhamensis TaxID=1508375 RepID=A0A941EJ65_9ACTN|nr:SRPBCC family protein [Actinospica durhamensis]
MAPRNPRIPGRSLVSISVRVRAEPEQVWAALTDWESQGTWIAATTVRTVEGDGRGVGARIEAFTGFGRLGFLDTMVVTEWLPPRRCAVRHTGAVVRGTGGFELVPAADPADGTTLTWYEDLDIPGGRPAAHAFALLRPAVEYGVLRSLHRFAALVEHRAGSTAGD